MPASDFIVIGGGIMGCGVAWRLAGEGARVTLLERATPGAEASSAAAGLLLPMAGREGGPPLLAHWLASLAMYPDFVAALQSETGMPFEFRIPGRLLLACSEEELAALQASLRVQQEAGVRAELWPAEQARAAEPALTPTVAGALYFPDHALVDNRRLTSCLAIAAARRGVAIRNGCPAIGLMMEGERVTGVEVPGERLAAGAVVIAAGCWSGLIDRRLPLPVTPAKGQVLALETQPPPFRHILASAGGALSARSDGRIIFGATIEQAGYDKRVTAGGMAKLLAGSSAICPALMQAPILETWAGLRPMTTDRLPIVGQIMDGLYAAGGHYQTGILAAPASTAALAGLMLSDSSPLPIDAFSPARFGKAARKAGPTEGGPAGR